ncbi:hypothetical protein NPIL_654901 [Nephila pilipes]|uniref:Uncharacterized protein n=1 Tax=Nephila pilipes TaxID=299642 RepID=A0A8X6K9G8_NEPPI|nr:hypothetical protein NPIL_654901 [Nephila pilipes]
MTSIHHSKRPISSPRQRQTACLRNDCAEIERTGIRISSSLPTQPLSDRLPLFRAPRTSNKRKSSTAKLQKTENASMNSFKRSGILCCRSQ